MKAFTTYISLVLLTLVLFSCEEVGPIINLEENEASVKDTTYLSSTVETPQAKNVILEEWTGVRCNNCPSGHAKSEEIKAANIGRVVSVSLHDYDGFTPPYKPPAYTTDTSKYDFRTSEAEDIKTELTIPASKPQGMIDRIGGTGSNMVYDIADWSNLVNNRLSSVTPPVNITTDHTYDPNTRELDVSVTVHYTVDVTAQNKLSIFITESDIEDTQLLQDATTRKPDYIHNDVLRTTLTNSTGDGLNDGTEAGRVYIRTYKITVDDSWDDNHLELIAFVHEFGGTNDVYQVAFEHITP